MASHFDLREGIDIGSLSMVKLYSLLQRVKDAIHEDETKVDTFATFEAMHKFKQPAGTVDVIDEAQLYRPASECYMHTSKENRGSEPFEVKPKQEAMDIKLETKNDAQIPLLAAASSLVQPKQEAMNIRLNDAQNPSLPAASSIVTSPLLTTDDQNSLLFNDLLGPVFEDQGLIKQTKEETLADELLEYNNEFSADSKTLSLHMDVCISSSISGTNEEESGTERHYHQLPIPDIVTRDNSEASGNEQDLNKVSTQKLAGEKKRMDFMFEANSVQPGEKYWQYDKQQEFGQPKIESGWDSDSSSTQEF